MIKKLLILILLFTSTLVHSDWKYVTSSGDKEMDFYVDSETFTKRGNLVNVWIKTEFKKTQRDSILDLFNGYLSSRSYEQWDCKDRTIMEISYDRFSKNNLEGKIVQSQSTLVSIPDNVRPDSSGSRILKFLCSK